MTDKFVRELVAGCVKCFLMSNYPIKDFKKYTKKSHLYTTKDLMRLYYDGFKRGYKIRGYEYRNNTDLEWEWENM